MPAWLRQLPKGWSNQMRAVLVVNTGSGLKDVRAAMPAVAEAPMIEPTVEAVKQCQ